MIAAVWIPAGLFHLGTISLGYLILWIGYSEYVNLRWLTLRGDYSNGAYLHAWPIQQLLIKFIPGLGLFVLFLLAAPLAWLAGLVSWHLIENAASAADHSALPPERSNQRGFDRVSSKVYTLSTQ